MLAVVVDLFPAFAVEFAIFPGRKEVCLKGLLQGDLSCDFSGADFFQNLLKQFTAGALLLPGLLFQYGKYRTGKGKAVQAGFLILQFLLQMVMDGGSILGRVIINAQKLAVPFCQGIVLQIVQRGERTNDRGLWL